jgi:hypothetical protein
VRHRVNIQRLGVEVPYLGQVAQRTRNVTPAEKLPRLGTQLAQYHVVTRFGISLNRNLIDPCLLTLVNPYFDIDRIIFNKYLYGHDVEEKVTIIHVKRADV